MVAVVLRGPYLADNHVCGVRRKEGHRIVGVPAGRFSWNHHDFVYAC